MANIHSPSPLVDLQSNTALAVMLLCIFFASFPQTPVISCDISTKDDNIHEPLLAAAFFGDDHFIAVFNVSDSICIFQAPGTAVANGKVTLPVGKNLKEVWPDLELEKIVHFAVIVSDKHGGHYMLFHYEATDDEYDIPLRTDVIVDLVTNKVHEGHLPKMFTFPLSTKEPMTMYSYAQFYGSGYLKRAVYPGHRLLKQERYEVTAEYLFCSPKGGTGGQQVAVVTLMDIEHGISSYCPVGLELKFPDELMRETSGFSDDKNFYVVGQGIVLTFGRDAIGGKLGQTVPFTVTNFTDFFVRVDNSGEDDSRKSKKKGINKTVMWILIGVAVVAVFGLMVAVLAYFCFCSSNKPGHYGYRQNSSSSHDGGDGRRRGGSKSKKRKSTSKTRRKSSKRGGSSIKPSRSRHSKPNMKRKHSSTTAKTSQRPISHR